MSRCLKKTTSLKNVHKFTFLTAIKNQRFLRFQGAVAHRFFDDKEEYERAKMGMADVPPYAILYRGEDDVMQGVEDLVESFVPEGNPLRRYYEGLVQED